MPRRGLRLALVLLAAAASSVGWAAAATPLDVGVVDDLAPVVREAAALWVAETSRPVSVHPYTHAQMMDFAANGHMDVLVASCDRSGDIFAEKGFVDSATRGGAVCRRMAVIVRPQNPKRVRGLEDLDRRDLRWGMAGVCSWRTEDLRKDKGDSFVVLSEDVGLVLDLLAEDRLDAVLTWDTAVAEDPRGFVVIRLPSSQCGEAFRALVPVFVGADAEDRKAAASLAHFLSSSVHAKDTYLAHGYMLDDGADAAEYDRHAAPRFQKVYENISRQIVDDYGVTNGLAVDIGCGPGQLVLELARTTDLHVIGVDIEPECIAIARRHAKEAGLEGRTDFVCADAHSLPLPDDYADLVVSRGTLPFLRDQALAIREVYRVLKPGGVAFLGGGMGRYTPEEEATKLYPTGVAPDAALDWGPGQTREDSIFPFPVRSFEVLMTRAGVADYTVINEGGRWVAFRK